MPKFPLNPIASFLSLEEMHGLIEEKKSRRENLNIFVLSANGYGEKNYNSELNIFFKLLSKNISNSETSSRFQLAIGIRDHWFSVDCYIKDNQIYLLVLDASVVDSSAEIVKKAALNLNPIIFSYRGIGIQYDFESCSFFTLDHLFRLSNRDQHWNDLLELTSPVREKIIYFDHNTCPNSLAFIFKNLQSLKGLDKLPETLKTSVVNQKNKTLEQAIMQNSQFERIKYLNKGIISKQENYMKRGAYFFKPMNYKKIATSRQGFEVIGGEMGELINEIINHKGKNYLKAVIKNNETFIKDNIRAMLDIAICYDLKNFLILLIETKLLSKEFIKISDICSLINKKPIMFKSILEYVKDSLTHADISEIQHTINFSGTEQFKDDLESILTEKPSQYSISSLSS